VCLFCPIHFDPEIVRDGLRSRPARRAPVEAYERKYAPILNSWNDVPGHLLLPSRPPSILLVRMFLPPPPPPPPETRRWRREDHGPSHSAGGGEACVP
jgi:hypothetical protein